MYDDLKYAQQRLTETIVRTNEGVPIYVLGVFLRGEDNKAQVDGVKVANVVAKRRGYAPALEADFLNPQYIPRPALKQRDLVQKCTAKDLEVEYIVIKTSENGKASLDKIDISSPPLGYLNNGGTSVYITRVPIRGYWRQGIGLGNICVVGDGGKDEVPNFASPPYSDTIMGKYPSYEECLEKVWKKEKTKVAFSRHFALSKTSLYYKGYVVGTLDKFGQVDFNKNKFYLNDHLFEEKNGQH